MTAPVWPFRPDPFRARLEWATAVLGAYEAEQRLALREAPRLTLSLPCTLSGTRIEAARDLACRVEAGLKAVRVPDWRYPVPAVVVDTSGSGDGPPPTTLEGEIAVAFVIDLSRNARTGPVAAMKEAVRRTIAGLAAGDDAMSLAIVPTVHPALSAPTDRAWHTFDAAAAADALAYIDGLPSNPSGERTYNAAAQSVDAFMDAAGARTRVCILVMSGDGPGSDAEAIARFGSIAGLAAYGIAFERFAGFAPDTATLEAIDNTSADGVPIVAADADAIEAAIAVALSSVSA